MDTGHRANLHQHYSARTRVSHAEVSLLVSLALSLRKARADGRISVRGEKRVRLDGPEETWIPVIARISTNIIRLEREFHMLRSIVQSSDPDCGWKEKSHCWFRWRSVFARHGRMAGSLCAGRSACARISTNIIRLEREFHMLRSIVQSSDPDCNHTIRPVSRLWWLEREISLLVSLALSLRKARADGRISVRGEKHTITGISQDTVMPWSRTF
jgi:hypothetical protein